MSKLGDLARALNPPEHLKDEVNERHAAMSRELQAKGMTQQQVSAAHLLIGVAGFAIDQLPEQDLRQLLAAYISLAYNLAPGVEASTVFGDGPTLTMAQRAHAMQAGLDRRAEAEGVDLRVWGKEHMRNAVCVLVATGLTDLEITVLFTDLLAAVRKLEGATNG